jgi:carbonic anhydrase
VADPYQPEIQAAVVIAGAMGTSSTSVPLIPLGPAEALADLLAGNRRFVAGRPRHGYHVTSEAGRQPDQRPYALVVGCLDSRVIPEALLDQDFGSILVVRTGGHVVDSAVLGSVEFAVSVIGVPLVLVLGHQYCGAVTTSVQALRSGQRPTGDLGYIVDAVAPALEDVSATASVIRAAAELDGHGTAAGEELAEMVERRHLVRTVELLAASQPSAGLIAAGKLAIVGARYDVDTGRLDLVIPGPAQR